MSKEISPKDDLQKATRAGLPLPKDASECGMEEAYDLGLLRGPDTDLRGVQPVSAYPLARTDFTRG